MVFVGQGTYGCVYRPPLKCKDKTINIPPGKISKLMLDAAAKKEVKEYTNIAQIDTTDKYYPGSPIQCKADPVDIRQNVSTNDCGVYSDNPFPNKYSLLFYTDGGVDLGKFVKNNLTSYLGSPIRREQVDKFMLHAHDLFKGLHLFSQHNFLHHDLKPGNIVFEPSTYKFNYIDFGLSTKSDKLIKEMIKQKDGEQFHWSYPFEFGLMNAGSPYYFYTKLTDQTISKMDRELRGIFKNKIKQNNYMVKADSYHSTFEFMANASTNEHVNDVINNYVDGFILGLNEARRTHMSYENFVRKCVLSADTYALGFTMNHMINAFYKEGAMPKPVYNDFRKVFEAMFDTNFLQRVSDTETLLNMYEQALVKTGITYRLRMIIENHEVKSVDASSTESPLIQLPQGPAVQPTAPMVQPQAPMVQPTAPAVQAQPPMALKRCPKGTRRNKRTGLCEPKTPASIPALIPIPVVGPAPTVGPESTVAPAPVKQKRCPNGTRRNKRTGLCEPK
jgi:serine/threonine protein kinase